MAKTIKVIAVTGESYKILVSGKHSLLKQGANLKADSKLIVPENGSVILKLPNEKVVEVKGKDLVHLGGVLDLFQLVQEFKPANNLESEIQKIEIFAAKYKAVEDDYEQSGDIIRLEDGRVFQKSGKDYVEALGEQFEEVPNQNYGGYRFVQLTRIGEQGVSDGISPLTLQRIIEPLSPLVIQYPENNLGFVEEERHGTQWSSLFSDNIVPVPNTPPVASDDTYTTPYNTPVTLTPLANDSDADGGTLTITAINGVALTPGTAQSTPRTVW